MKLGEGVRPGHCLFQLLFELVVDPAPLHVAHDLRILALGSSHLPSESVCEGLQPGGSIELIRSTVGRDATARLDHAVAHADHQDGSILAQFGGPLQGDLLYKSRTGDVVQNEWVCLMWLLLQQIPHFHFDKFSERSLY